jgi:hypothetical protein
MSIGGPGRHTFLVQPRADYHPINEEIESFGGELGIFYIMRLGSSIQATVTQILIRFIKVQDKRTDEIMVL